MSSKAHIIYTPDSEFYDETNQARYAFDKFVGYDIGVFLGFKDCKSFTFNDGILDVSVVPNSKLFEITGDKIRIFGSDLFDIECDADGLSFFIKGGSLSAKMITAKTFTPKSYSDSQRNTLYIPTTQP